MVERLTEKRNSQNTIPLKNAVCGIDMPYWALCNQDSVTDRYLAGDAADRLAAYEDLGTVEELAALKERTRWIPVSERLPEYYPNKGANAYWVAKKTRNGEWQIKIALYSDYGYAASVDIPENVTWRDYDFCQITNVAYWMPLPEAPKEAQA